jgi:hypothetical protein
VGARAGQPEWLGSGPPASTSLVLRHFGQAVIYPEFGNKFPPRYKHRADNHDGGADSVLQICVRKLRE